MAVLVHLCSEASSKSILRNGIRATKLVAPIHRGVYAMPKLPNFFVTHQWVRELKRKGSRTMVAVDLRLPDTEPVWIGRYNQPHELVELAAAVGILRAHDSPLGFELIVPRRIASGEVLRVREVPQNIGWRFYPEAKGKRPCPCSYCTRGEIKSRRIRERGAAQ